MPEADSSSEESDEEDDIGESKVAPPATTAKMLRPTPPPPAPRPPVTSIGDNGIEQVPVAAVAAAVHLSQSTEDRTKALSKDLRSGPLDNIMAWGRTFDYVFESTTLDAALVEIDDLMRIGHRFLRVDELHAKIAIVERLVEEEPFALAKAEAALQDARNTATHNREELDTLRIDAKDAVRHRDLIEPIAEEVKVEKPTVKRPASQGPHGAAPTAPPAVEALLIGGDAALALLSAKDAMNALILDTANCMELHSNCVKLDFFFGAVVTFAPDLGVPEFIDLMAGPLKMTMTQRFAIASTITTLYSTTSAADPEHALLEWKKTALANLLHRYDASEKKAKKKKKKQKKTEEKE
jgi:hypothetical protein